jgi:hypothetical protein
VSNPRCGFCLPCVPLEIGLAAARDDHASRSATAGAIPDAM